MAIPRGGEGLIRRVAAEAKMPVIKHFTGNCHVYVDAAADLEMAERSLINSQVPTAWACATRPSRCSCMRDVAAEFLPAHRQPRSPSKAVEIRGDERTCELVPERQAGDRRRLRHRVSRPDHFAARSSSSLDEAIEHINRYGSQHTDAIVTADARRGARVRRTRR